MKPKQNMFPKTYILQKDLPEANKGTQYTVSDDSETVYYVCDKNNLKNVKGETLDRDAWMPSVYDKWIIENKTDWFKLKEQKESYVDCYCYYEIEETKERIEATGNSQLEMLQKLLEELMIKGKLPIGKTHSTIYHKGKKEEIKVDEFKYTEGLYTYQFRCSVNISHFKYDAISRAIEFSIKYDDMLKNLL